MRSSRRCKAADTKATSRQSERDRASKAVSIRRHDLAPALQTKIGGWLNADRRQPDPLQSIDVLSIDDGFAGSNRIPMARSPPRCQTGAESRGFGRGALGRSRGRRRCAGSRRSCGRPQAACRKSASSSASAPTSPEAATPLGKLRTLVRCRDFSRQDAGKTLRSPRSANL